MLNKSVLRHNKKSYNDMSLQELNNERKRLINIKKNTKAQSEEFLKWIDIRLTEIGLLIEKDKV